MIVVCGTETSATYVDPTERVQWAPNAVPLPCFPNADRVGATDTRTGRHFKIMFKSVRLPVESAHSPFSYTVRGGVFGSQRGAASLSCYRLAHHECLSLKYQVEFPLRECSCLHQRMAIRINIKCSTVINNACLLKAPSH